MSVEKTVETALKKDVRVLIFWAEGCPYSERARDYGLELRREGIKVMIRKVGNINTDRSKLDKTAFMINEVLGSKQTNITWPQVLYRDKGTPFKRLDGGCEALLKKSFG